jgi:hypothetical protein
LPATVQFFLANPSDEDTRAIWAVTGLTLDPTGAGPRDVLCVIASDGLRYCDATTGETLTGEGVPVAQGGPFFRGDYKIFVGPDQRTLLVCACFEEWQRGRVPSTLRPIPGYEVPWFPEGPQVLRVVDLATGADLFLRRATEEEGEGELVVHTLASGALAVTCWHNGTVRTTALDTGAELWTAQVRGDLGLLADRWPDTLV